MSHEWEYDYSNLYNNNNAPQEAPGPGAPAGPSGMGGGSDFGGEPTGPLPGGYQNFQPPHKDHKWAKRITAGVLLVALCAGAGFGGGYLGGVAAKGAGKTVVYQAPSSTASTGEAGASQAVVTPSPSPDGSMTVAEIASKVGPSVVEVRTEQVATNAYFGQYVQGGAGSGVIISEDGYIITNNHVVSGAQQIQVTTADKQTYDATVVGTDSKTDIAVLKIEATGLTPATVGNSDQLAVGEFALAVGNPLGTLGGTVTDGIVSALNRDITVNGQTMTLLQTNAAVSPGNSGGGLFNSNGELIGIVNAKSSQSNVEGLGFAIPVNTAMEVAQSLIENGYVTGRPEFGIQVIAVTDAQSAMQYGVSRYGVYVAAVNEGSAAEKAGMQVGDLFVSVDGNAVSTTQDVTSVLDGRQVGDVVPVQVIRDNKVVELSVTLQEKVQAAAQPADSQPEQEQQLWP